MGKAFAEIYVTFVDVTETALRTIQLSSGGGCKSHEP